jgi:hypothetical protein
MKFKFTFGRKGDGWEGTEEWVGEINRYLPDPAAPIYRRPDGSLILLCEFGLVERF